MMSNESTIVAGELLNVATVTEMKIVPKPAAYPLINDKYPFLLLRQKLLSGSYYPMG